MTEPLITFYTNSFNRLKLLKNLLHSFELCNQYGKVEWVITDYGSRDGSREWLQQYTREASMPVKLIVADENKYFASLELPTLDQRTKTWAILRWYRNQARAAAAGDYYFDVATDHQFIRRGPWIEEILEIFSHRAGTAGHDDLACVVPLGYFRWRLDKMNNRRGQEQNSSGVPYYMAHTKAYVDYSVMRRSTAQRIGSYWELTALRRQPELIERWYQKDPALQPEAEYCRRAENLGLKRAFMKYPIIITFRNRELEELLAAREGENLIVPLWTLEAMQREFGGLARPISSDELCGAPLPGIVAKGRAVLERWRAWG